MNVPFLSDYGGYDPYNSYYGHQQMQYYENLRRKDPEAYAEWYRKYYLQLQQQQLHHQSSASVTGVAPHSMVQTDGRESVHSGRSSTNEKDRYI